MRFLKQGNNFEVQVPFMIPARQRTKYKGQSSFSVLNLAEGGVT